MVVLFELMKKKQLKFRKNKETTCGTLHGTELMFFMHNTQCDSRTWLSIEKCILLAIVSVSQKYNKCFRF